MATYPARASTEYRRTSGPVPCGRREVDPQGRPVVTVLDAPSPPHGARPADAGTAQPKMDTGRREIVPQRGARPTVGPFYQGVGTRERSSVVMAEPIAQPSGAPAAAPIAAVAPWDGPKHSQLLPHGRHAA